MPRFEFKAPQLSSANLFDLPPGGGYDSAVVRVGPSHWPQYATAYKNAADTLAGIASSDRFLRFSVGAPIMFLYRHYTELALKSLLLDAGELLDDPQDVPPKHYILSLWERVRELLDRVHPSSDDPWFKRADSIIRSLDDIDPTSFAFRYPVDVLSKPSFDRELLFDPTTVQAVMGELSVLLDGASAELSVLQDVKQSMYDV